MLLHIISVMYPYELNFIPINYSDNRNWYYSINGVVLQYACISDYLDKNLPNFKLRLGRPQSALLLYQNRRKLIKLPLVVTFKMM